MSHTPNFLIKKGEFDKAFLKIKDSVEDYFIKRSEFYRWKAEEKQSRQIKYEEVVRQCGSSPDGKVINNKVEKEVEESEEFKGKVKELLSEDSLSSVLEYYDDDEFYEIEGIKYYLISPELTSETKALAKFLDENGVPYAN